MLGGVNRETSPRDFPTPRLLRDSLVKFAVEHSMPNISPPKVPESAAPPSAAHRNSGATTDKDEISTSSRGAGDASPKTLRGRATIARGGGTHAAGVDDALSSVHFALAQGVFAGRSQLDAEQHAALRAWLALLAAAMPGGQTARQSVLVLLEQVVASAPPSAGSPVPVAHRPLNVSTWEHWLAEWRLGGRDAPRSWNAPLWSPACEPAADSGGGYTCGLWTLFHTLSFSAPAAGLKPSATMAAIRAFVEHFFGCEVCRRNFLDMYDRCLYGRCDIQDDADPAAQQQALAMWLWRAHNDVNLRLAAERDVRTGKDIAKFRGAQDANSLASPFAAVAATWPSRTLCADCYSSTSATGADLGQNGRMDEEGVLAYLSSVYSQPTLGGIGANAADTGRSQPSALFWLPAWLDSWYSQLAAVLCILGACACLCCGMKPTRRRGQQREGARKKPESDRCPKRSPFGSTRSRRNAKVTQVNVV